MAQNTSSAVMAQRSEPHDSLDFFPTPPWATRALCEHVLAGHGWRLGQLAKMTAWESACGTGTMAKPLAEYFSVVYSSDCHDYGFGHVDDFLMPGSSYCRPDWIITNPPFRLAEQFIARARGIARVGVAMLVRVSFIESIGRYQRLFSPDKAPPGIVAAFTERVPMFKGRLDPKGSTATAYAWLVWDLSVRGWQGTRLIWIPPCRKELERPGDYEAGEVSP